MTYIPILDAAYMERRAQRLMWEARAETLERMFGTVRRAQQPVTVESLRDSYASGSITLEEFERRLDEVLR